jgi:hemolysin-activating ACP:hemolysin acyltransferase
MSVATETEQQAAAGNAEQLKSLDKAHIGAAMSKLISAAIGDIVVVMSKSPAYKFHTLADIEWLVMPAVLTGQYFVAELQHPETGVRGPVAVVTWASVSDEVSARLADLTLPSRLIPDDWASGPNLWLMHVVGEPQVLARTLAMLNETQFKGANVKFTARDVSGAAQVNTLSERLTVRGNA